MSEAMAKGQAKSKAKAKAKAKAKEQPKEEKVIEAILSDSEKENGGAEAPAAKKKKNKKKKSGAADGETPAQEVKEETKPKGQSHQAETPKPQKKAPEPVEDDGIDHSDAFAAGEWETATKAPKKQALREERKKAEREAELAAQKSMKAQQLSQSIPGMAAQHIPGSAAAAAAKGQGPQAKAKAKAGPGQAAEAPAAAPAADAALSAITIKVPEKKVGHVIGPKGSTLELIKEKSGVTRIDTSGEEFTICGNPKATAIAELAIKEIIEKGYTSLAFDNFSADFVMVPPPFLSELIGKEGCVIRAIKDQLKAEINIPQGIARTATKKVKVTIAGSKEAVEKAKEVVTDIITVYHHEVTHPGMTHEEIDVEPWAISFVIGKKGSEMRHIQQNFKVKVYLPGEGKPNTRTVIVGEPRDVERAKTYVEKLVWNAQNAPARGRGSDGGGGDDHWGEEEEHEGWMDAYVYKRR